MSDEPTNDPPPEGDGTTNEPTPEGNGGGMSALLERIAPANLNWREAILLPLLAVLSALIVGAVIIALTEGPGEILSAYASLFKGAFVGWSSISETLVICRSGHPGRAVGGHRLQGRSVQYRRRGPDDHRWIDGGHCRLHLHGSPGLHPSSYRPSGRSRGRSDLGRVPRLVAGADRSSRGHHHDHAELDLVSAPRLSPETALDPEGRAFRSDLQGRARLCPSAPAAVMAPGRRR